MKFLAWIAEGIVMLILLGFFALLLMLGVGILSWILNGMTGI